MSNGGADTGNAYAHRARTARGVHERYELLYTHHLLVAAPPGDELCRCERVLPRRVSGRRQRVHTQGTRAHTFFRVPRARMAPSASPFCFSSCARPDHRVTCNTGSKTKPTNPIQTKPNQTKNTPNQTKPNRTNSNQTKPSHTETKAKQSKRNSMGKFDSCCSSEPIPGNHATGTARRNCQLAASISSEYTTCRLHATHILYGVEHVTWGGPHEKRIRVSRAPVRVSDPFPDAPHHRLHVGAHQPLHSGAATAARRAVYTARAAPQRARNPPPHTLTRSQARATCST